MNIEATTKLWLCVTYQCPARCAHCLVDGGPEQTAWMSVEEAEEHIRALSAGGVLDTVGIVGGEPLLRPDLILKMGHLAKRCGVPDVMIAGTNCFWASSDKRAREILGACKRAGIGIGFSLDAFHQEYIPAERVERACRIAKELEMGDAYRPNACVIESMGAGNRYDTETRRLARLFESRGFPVDICQRGRVGHYGRAAALADHCGEPKSIPRETCTDVPWVCGALDRPGALQIDCDGWVMLEFGITIGNTRENSLRDILENYDPASHPIVSVLMSEGPIGLTELSEAKDFRLRPEGYVDKCHLCYEIRDHLRPFFPDVLGPAACYPSTEV